MQDNNQIKWPSSRNLYTGRTEIKVCTTVQLGDKKARAELVFTAWEELPIKDILPTVKDLIIRMASDGSISHSILGALGKHNGSGIHTTSAVIKVKVNFGVMEYVYDLLIDEEELTQSQTSSKIRDALILLSSIDSIRSIIFKFSMQSQFLDMNYKDYEEIITTMHYEEIVAANAKDNMP